MSVRSHRRLHSPTAHDRFRWWWFGAAILAFENERREQVSVEVFGESEEVLRLTSRGVALSIGRPAYDSNDPVGRLLFNVLGMVAEFEARRNGRPCSTSPPQESTPRSNSRNCSTCPAPPSAASCAAPRTDTGTLDGACGGLAFVEG